MKGVAAHIPSSALGYAISFLLLIGMVCTGVLFISSANKRLEMQHELSEHMLFNNYLGLKIGASSEGFGQRQIVHPSGDTSQLTIRNWGAFRAVTSHTFHKERSLNKSALVGFILEQKLPALYMPNRREIIKLCGTTRIEGDAYVSKRGFERGHIAGQRYDGDKLLYGNLYESEKQLPQLKLSATRSVIEESIQTAHKLEVLPEDSSFSFTQVTSLWSTVEPIYLRQALEGNLIVHSFDSIFVSATALLNHVILIAPIIRFEKGFVGCVQAIAEQRISCEEGVLLNYPSALMLREKDGENAAVQAGIFIAVNARVLGGILLTSAHPNFRNPVHLSIEGVVGGLVYNEGETELKGTIIGSLYTANLALRAGGGEYKGYLLNAILSSKELPEAFIFPDWLDEEQRNESKLLTCF